MNFKKMALKNLFEDDGGLQIAGIQDLRELKGYHLKDIRDMNIIDKGTTPHVRLKKHPPKVLVLERNEDAERNGEIGVSVYQFNIVKKNYLRKGERDLEIDDLMHYADSRLIKNGR